MSIKVRGEEAQTVLPNTAPVVKLNYIPANVGKLRGCDLTVQYSVHSAVVQILQGGVSTGVQRVTRVGYGLELIGCYS